jgi:hypothetical protein
MDNPEILETVRENRRDNQEWKIQRHWQQLEKTDGQSRMDNPETLVTVRENQRGNQEWTIQRYWQQLEKTDGTIKNGQSRDTGNI